MKSLQQNLETIAANDNNATGAAIDQPAIEERLDVIDAHVVILNNYLRQHHVAAYKEIARRVRKLTILLSVDMEPDRKWEAQWDGLDVIIQKNKMFTTKWRHSSGFSEDNFIHIPVDTRKQLKSLNPDIIFSYEMGMRTLLCGFYRMFHRNCRLVMVGNMSEHIERERGFFRKSLRKTILRCVDYFTYNGPSCKRYLKSLGVADDKLFHFPYCIDPESVSTDPRATQSANTRELLYCGAMSSRKGILQFAQIAQQWSTNNPDLSIRLNIAGTGELQDSIAKLSTNNFAINFLGNCDQRQLRDAYRNADVCVFPTLADEWGLVPIEAMASGLPVLGSIHAQSVESCVVEGENGWVFNPESEQTIESALDRCMTTTAEDLLTMGIEAKSAVSYITPSFSANEACHVISLIATTLQEK